MSIVSGTQFDLSIGINKSDGKLHDFIPMNMEQAACIYKYYMHKENWLSICRDTIFALTFEGGVEERWAKRMTSKSANIEKEEELIALLTKALDYKNMFGMCPIKIVYNEVTKTKSAVIPQFGTGQFLQRLNPITLSSEVIFVPYKYGKQKNIIKTIEMDPSVFVFVWPDHEPDFHLNAFRSKMFKLYEKFLIYKEREENDLDAEFNACHPTVFTQKQRDNRSISEVTEEEIYADADEDNGGNIDEIRTYRREISRAKQLEAMQLNAKMNDGFTNKVKQRVDLNTNQVVSLKRKRIWEDNRYNLEEGEELVQHTIPRNSLHLLDHEEAYEQQVCLAMGVPKNYIIRKLASRGLKGDVKNEQHLLRKTVLQNRHACVLFYTFVYNLLFKEDDDAMIINMFQELDTLEAQNKETKQASSQKEDKEITNKEPTQSNEEGSESIKRETTLSMVTGSNMIAQMRANLEVVAKTKYRAELIFREDPFDSTFDIEEITQMADRGAISSLEEVNMLRRRIGYPTVTPISSLVSENQKIRKLQIEGRNKGNDNNSHQNGHSQLKKVTKTSNKQQKKDKKPKDNPEKGPKK